MCWKHRLHHSSTTAWPSHWRYGLRSDAVQEVVGSRDRVYRPGAHFHRLRELRPSASGFQIEAPLSDHQDGNLGQMIYIRMHDLRAPLAELRDHAYCIHIIQSYVYAIYCIHLILDYVYAICMISKFGQWSRIHIDPIYTYV